LKGSVGNFAAKPAFDAAFDLEKIARRGDFDQMPQAVDALDFEMRRLRAALEGSANQLSEMDESSLAPPPPPAAASPGLNASLG